MTDPKPDIKKMDINEIKESGLFTPKERAAEYRRRGKSPSGVINGVVQRHPARQRRVQRCVSRLGG